MPPNVRFTQIWASNTAFRGAFSVALGTDGNVYSWGQNDLGQLGLGDTNDRLTPTKVTLPAGVTRFTQIASGSCYALAIADNGKVYSWGVGAFLGVGGTVNRTSPTAVVGIPNDVRIVSISASNYHSMALGDNGVIYSWGSNSSAQLGIGDLTDRTSAVAITPPAGLRWTSATAGGYTSFATASDGNDYAWGSNQGVFQYGNGMSVDTDGPTAEYRVPTRIHILLPAGVHIVQRSTNGHHTLAIGSDHKTYAWGSNNYGELGDGSGVLTPPTPVEVSTPAGVTFISVIAGYWSSYAVGSDGNSYAWGKNQGSLGDGSTVDRTTPVRIGGVTRITRVTIGGQVTAGTINPVSGVWTGATLPHAPGDVDVVVELTLNTVPQPSETLSFRYLDTFTVSFDLGGAPGSPPGSQNVLERSKAAWPVTPAWSDKTFTGWYIDGKPYTFNEPVTQSITLTAKWEQYGISLSPSSGTTMGNTQVSLNPLPKESTIKFSQVSVGWYHSLGLGSNGLIYAWGKNNAGQLGDGTTDNHVVPMAVNTPAGIKFSQIAAGPNTSFALGSDNRWYAWGANGSGQLGNGNTTNQLTPVAISMPAGVGAYTQVSPGDTHTLALGDNGIAYAWGANSSGQLGNNSTASSLSPVTVQTPPGVFHFTSLSAGSVHSLAIGDNGLPYAWGSNQYGQVGSVLVNVGDTSPAPVEVQLPVGINKFKQATATADWSLGIASNGRILTWGYNGDYELGNGTTVNQAIPGEPNLPAGVTFNQVITNSDSAMAIGSNHQIYAWGYNGAGQLGNGNQTSPASPITVNPKPGITFTQLHTGWKHTIGVDTSGNIWTWGSNAFGQLGDGSGGTPGSLSLTPVSLTPVKLTITGVTMDGQAPQTGPTYDPATGTWKLTTHPHAEGTVPVSVAWSLSGVPQPNYPLTYTYTDPLTLPTAGSIPLQRLTGALLLTLSLAAAVTYATRQKSRTRKQPH
ncbi:hypothetical protein KIMH_05200 [Bombiscardovia apis]|uniref:RCC1-like domain-containing protein n=2 Tax=Bombiscardovia apis TaxID=2932182 RepID=A0ABM8BCK2_9BIFI|nr:hypothetical protein KIMH_05200 [Bombiscardovia apis]